MKSLVFNTQIPFGYWLLALTLLALAGFAGALIFIGLARKPRKVWLVSPACLMLAFVIIVAAVNAGHEEVNLNPLIRKSSVLTGTWRGDASIVELLPDGLYTCRGRACAPLGERGLWQRSGDFFISFDQIGSRPVVLRITALAGHLRLTADEAPGESGLGRSGLTLEHTAPWLGP